MPGEMFSDIDAIRAVKTGTWKLWAGASAVFLVLAVVTYPPPPTPPPPVEVFGRVQGQLVKLDLSKYVKPSYPREYQQTGQSATVWVNIYPGEKGEIGTLGAWGAPEPFMREALQAVKQWQFQTVPKIIWPLEVKIEMSP